VRYGRPVDHSTAQDGTDIRMIDPIDVPSPLPAWAASDAVWLARIFPTLSGWKAIPSKVQPGSRFVGSVNTPAHFSDPQKFLNWDGTYGDGSPIPPEE